MTNIIEGGPECQRDDCCVTDQLQFVTLAYHPPMLDQCNNNQNPDNNVTVKKKHCLSCGKIWEQRSQLGVITDWKFV